MQFGQSQLIQHENQTKSTKIKILGTVYNTDAQQIFSEVQTNNKQPVQELQGIEQVSTQKKDAKLLQDLAEIAIQRRKEDKFRNKYQL